jgi:DNA-binding transcriptional ArsR family regulator
MLYGDLLIAKKSFFSALSDETRLIILYTLKERGGMCVNDIEAIVRIRVSCRITGGAHNWFCHHEKTGKICLLYHTE